MKRNLDRTSKIGLVCKKTFAPVSVDEMRSIESEGERIGISRLILMENAGNAIASYVAKKYLGQNSFPPASRRTKILIVAGTGNNGGDAFVAGRHLAFWSSSFRIIVFLVGKESEIRSKEARKNWMVLSQIRSIERNIIDSTNKIKAISDSIKEARVLIIGIFGTGFQGKPRELQKNVIEFINHNKGPEIISVDLPSGMEADSGKCEHSVWADVTITMHAPKIGMAANPLARRKCGKIIVANIGLPF